MKNFIEKMKKNWLVKGTTTAILVIVLIALFVALTIWVNNLNLDPIDFTADKLYTLTDTSKERVKDITEDVNIYFVGYSEDNTIVDLTKQYHNANEKINVELVNAVDRSDLVQKYGIDSSSMGVIVESGDKYKVLTSSDFYTYDATTYEQIDITEEKMTNAIMYVTAEKIPTVYFMEGYSDFTIEENMTYLSAYLGNEVTKYSTVNILTTGKVPDDCDTLVITSPNNDFDDVTTNAIVEYINKGGNILWFNMALPSEQNYANVNKILAMYGVKPFEVGFINETDSSKRTSTYSNVIIPNVDYSDITKNITTLLLANATKINFVSDEELESLNIVKTNLLESSEKSYFRTKYDNSNSNKQSGEEDGPFVIGAELQKTVSKANEETGEKERISKLVIYGENGFISDYSLDSSSKTPLLLYYNNKNLVLDSIAYLVDRQEDIVIRKDVNTVSYTATVEQDSIIQAIIFGVPIVIMVAGVIVWQHRRRKK